MAEEVFEGVVQEEQKEDDVIMYDYKKISDLFRINENKAGDFLKKFGVKVGHWQIEKGSLLSVLRENRGEKLI